MLQSTLNTSLHSTTSLYQHLNSSYLYFHPDYGPKTSIHATPTVVSTLTAAVPLSSAVKVPNHIEHEKGHGNDIKQEKAKPPPSGFADKNANEQEDKRDKKPSHPPMTRRQRRAHQRRARRLSSTRPEDVPNLHYQSVILPGNKVGSKCQNALLR